MSDCKLDRIYELDLPPNKIMVLMAVAKGELSVPRIAWKTKYSEVQIRRILKALTKVKLLNITHASQGRYRTLYALNDETIGTWKRKEPYQDDEVQPNQNDNVAVLQPDQPNQNDEVSDSQLAQNDRDDRVEPHQNDKNDRVENPPLNNSPKDSQTATTTSNGPVTGKLLIESWIMAHPGDKKPRYTYTKINLALANSLAATGVTPQHVSAITLEKLVGRTKYEFKWLAEDIRLRREVTRATTYCYDDDAEDDPDSFAARLKADKPAAPEPVPELLLITGPNGKTREEAWQIAMTLYEQQDLGNYRTWLRDAQLVDWRDGAFVISVRNQHVADLCQYKLYRSIQNKLTEVYSSGEKVALCFEAIKQEVA